MKAFDRVDVSGLYTGADAIKEVKRRYAGRVVTFYARMCSDLPIVDTVTKQQTNRVFPGALYAHVPLTRKQALAFVTSLADNMAGLEERGGRIPIEVTHDDWGATFTPKTRYRTRVRIG